jgi:hypothetical protein
VNENEIEKKIHKLSQIKKIIEIKSKKSKKIKDEEIKIIIINIS